MRDEAVRRRGRAQGGRAQERQHAGTPRAGEAMRKGKASSGL